MLFLVDEDSAAETIVAALKKLGHTVYVASDILPNGTADVKVAGHAESIGAVLVTRNKKDFWPYLKPGPHAHPRAFKRAGALFLMCEHHHISERRIHAFDTVVKAEHARVMATADPRFLVEITEDRVSILR